MALLVGLDGLVLSDLILDGLLLLSLLGASGTEALPLFSRVLKRCRDLVGKWLCCETGNRTCSAEDLSSDGLRRTGCTLDGAGHLAQSLGSSAAHVAGLDGLPACAVCKYTGQKAGGLLGCFKSAEYQYELSYDIDGRAVLIQHQLRA